MIVGAVVIFAVGIFFLWLLLARGSQLSKTSEQQFDEEYERLVAQGEASETDRDAAWQDFNAWQLREQRDERSRADDEGTWEEGL